MLDSITAEQVWWVGGIVVSALIGSGLMTPITRLIKKHMELTKMMIVFVVFLVTDGIIWLATNSTLPPEFAPLIASAQFVVAQPFYLKIWKPIAIRFGAMVAAYNEKREDDVKSAAQPIEPMPVVEAPEPVDLSH
jgi:hypothetical protein